MLGAAVSGMCPDRKEIAQPPRPARPRKPPAGSGVGRDAAGSAGGRSLPRARTRPPAAPRSGGPPVCLSLTTHSFDPLVCDLLWHVMEAHDPLLLGAQCSLNTTKNFTLVFSLSQPLNCD